MKIKRKIDGKEYEFELTRKEMFNAFKEVDRHASKEDILNVLDEVLNYYMYSEIEKDDLTKSDMNAILELFENCRKNDEQRYLDLEYSTKTILDEVLERKERGL